MAKTTTAPRTTTTTCPEWCDPDACMAIQAGDPGVADSLIHFGPITSIPLGTFDRFGDPQFIELYREQHVDADTVSVRVTVSGRDMGLVMTPDSAIDLATALVYAAPLHL